VVTARQRIPTARVVLGAFLSTAIILFPAVREVSSQAGSPVVSAVIGAMSHGTSVVINGSNFGSKPAGPPLKWDDANGAAGARLEPRGWLVANQLQQPDLVDHHLRGTPGEQTIIRLRHGMQGDSDDVGLFGYGNDPNDYLELTAASVPNFKPFPQAFYVDYWMYLEKNGTPGMNWKIIRHHNAAGGDSGGLAWANGRNASDDASFYGSPTWSGLPTPQPYITMGSIEGSWHHFQFYNVFATNGTGELHLWVDGIKRSSLTGRTFGSARVNWMFETQILGDSGNPALAINYFDDIYLDNTPARVEIGNHPVYANATHREIQIPSAWADNQVTVSLNRGTFPSFSGLYVYVVSAQGVASPGFELTGSSGPGAPTNLRVVP
jgi:hypothetical protein